MNHPFIKKGALTLSVANDIESHLTFVRAKSFNLIEVPANELSQVSHK
jgi:hypothetical protein